MISKPASHNAFFLTLFAIVATLSSAVAAPPNIVFILTDDQGYGDISAHGNPILKTPHLDRLRAESVRFTDFHVSPTCAPTRSALLTGRHESKTGSRTPSSSGSGSLPRRLRLPKC